MSECACESESTCTDPNEEKDTPPYSSTSQGRSLTELSLALITLCEDSADEHTVVEAVTVEEANIRTSGDD